jgi:hypothetical protein
LRAVRDQKERIAFLRAAHILTLSFIFLSFSIGLLVAVATTKLPGVLYLPVLSAAYIILYIYCHARYLNHRGLAYLVDGVDDCSEKATVQFVSSGEFQDAFRKTISASVKDAQNYYKVPFRASQ